VPLRNPAWSAPCGPLNNPTDPDVLPSPLPATGPAPYNGSTAIAISVNGMQTGVVVTDGTNLNEGNVVAAG
jgi:hypothetical protein